GAEPRAAGHAGVGAELPDAGERFESGGRGPRADPRPDSVHQVSPGSGRQVTAGPAAGSGDQVPNWVLRVDVSANRCRENRRRGVPSPRFFFAESSPTAGPSLKP